MGKVSINSCSFLNHGGKKVAFEALRPLCRDAIKDGGFEDIDAGIDHVAGYFVLRRLFGETQDPALGIGFDKAISTGFITRAVTIVASALLDLWYWRTSKRSVSVRSRR